MKLRPHRGIRASLSTVLVYSLLIACGSIPLRPNDAQEDARRILEILHAGSGATVGEIGGGDGDVAVAVAALLGHDGQLFVTELDPAKLDSMRKRFAAQKGGTVTVVTSSSNSTNLAEDCCDGIYMRDVYHHFTNPGAMVESLYRSIKPGGRLVVIDFRPGTGPAWSIPPGVPSNRGGHGIPIAILREELEAGGFQHIETIEKWRGTLFAVVAEKPR